MDYGRSYRKELEALCKEHGIPTNTTHAKMVKALGALLNAPTEIEQAVNSVPDLGEGVKVKAKRPARTKQVAIQVDDLSTQLAKSTLATHSFQSAIVQSASEDPKVKEQEQIGVALAPVEESSAKAVAKKSKAKSKRLKEVKVVSPIRVHILEDEVVPRTPRMTSVGTLDSPMSPTPGLALSSPFTHKIQRPVSLSPAPEDEFQAVPQSFAEIMTPGKPLVQASKQCQHRLGRKSGKSCSSCAYEKKTSNLVQEVLQITPSRRTFTGGDPQSGVTRVPLQKLCNGLRPFGSLLP